MDAIMLIQYQTVCKRGMENKHTKYNHVIVLQYSISKLAV